KYGFRAQERFAAALFRAVATPICASASLRRGQDHGPQQVRTVEQLRARTVEPDLAFLHEHRALREAERCGDRLLDDDHRGPGLVDLPDDVEQRIDDLRRETERELVDE